MFKIGDKVRYVSGAYGSSDYNPLWPHQMVLGTITSVLGTSEIMVHWDNGNINNYWPKDLKLSRDILLSSICKTIT